MCVIVSGWSACWPAERLLFTSMLRISRCQQRCLGAEQLGGVQSLSKWTAFVLRCLAVGAYLCQAGVCKTPLRQSRY